MKVRGSLCAVICSVKLILVFFLRVLFSVANDGAIPFNTQFFHDDDDDGPGFDDLYDGDGLPDGDPMPVDAEPGERDLLSETQGQTRRVRPEAVNYARRAKRVDVRKLKENIWRGLDIVIPPSQGTHDDDGDISMVCWKLHFRQYS